MVFVGLVMMVIMSLFQSTQRSAYTEEDVVELQQNLRNALDLIVQDLQMAGFMIPSGEYPISTAPPFLCRDLNSDGDCSDTNESFAFSLKTASVLDRIARIDQDFAMPDPLDTETDYPVGLAEMCDLFDGGDLVRVIRPANSTDIFGHTLTVASKNRSTPKIVLTGFTTGDEGTQVKKGDMIVRVGSSTFPGEITYTLNMADSELKRNNGSSTQVVAEGITDMQLNYLMEDGSKTNSTAVSGTSRDDIIAVEVTLTGRSNTVNGNKTREVTNVINIRNK
jgi:hypothetical protein